MPASTRISLTAYDGPHPPCVCSPAGEGAVIVGDCDRRVFRPPPPGARRPRSGPQTPRDVHRLDRLPRRSEEHTSELQSLMRISYAVFCLKKNTMRLESDTATNTPN